ncbi:dihydroorotase [Salibacteraceae bacterium]|jgi:dihydroorotase|nr:dihydroorotase [Salibacteraceae bacterium]MDB4104725.1 dihydroorotase [Salibacteraceae bacterium]MDB9710191.1 dihydroorotase [Salibacteraceae bacterium]MDC1304219.1 dihydroorotase [Salibacteraceae bacterium]HAQ69498.1 dihydroorotase [Flavobacteriales bacterium]
MRTYIKNATIIYPEHKLHNKVVNLLVNNSLIESINPNNPNTFDHEIDAKNMLLFPGLVDIQCFSGEPGNEDREDFESLTRAAKSGGFSDLFIMPDTSPTIETKSSVRYIEHASGKNGIRLHAIGAVSKNLKGEELSEMYDMHLSGAKAFSDAKRPIGDVNMMKRALDYVKSFNGIVYSFPLDERVSPGGMVNESPLNTALGLKSTPKLAEELLLNRDIYLLNYCESRMHVSSISSEDSISLIETAKQKGLDISCSVALSHLLFSENQLNTFNTNYKTNPPLRSESDRQALIEGLKSGTIDIIHSDHSPEVIEDKDVEFDQAKHGMTMLETALAAYNTNLKDQLSFEAFINAFSINPRKRFDMAMPELEAGSDFNFALFDPSKEWVYDAESAQSKSTNSPFLNQTLKGKVIEV